MPSGDALLVVDRDLDTAMRYLQTKIDGDQCRRLTPRVFRVDEPSSELGGVLERMDKYRDEVGWGPSVADDRQMNIMVHGAPMDVGGDGSPSQTNLILPPRIDASLPTFAAGNGSDAGSGEGVIVGVVDTGAVHHPWLDGSYLAAPADFERTDDPESQAAVRKTPRQAGHGTFVSGMILQQAPAAAVWIERALAQDGDAPSSQVVAAAKLLTERGVKVLNLSLGVFAEEPGFKEVMATLVEDLYRINPELVIVAAAGNLDPDKGDAPRPFWPAALPGVIAVGSLKGHETQDPDGRPEWAEWSNRGDWVDFAACGDQVVSTFLHGDFDYEEGGTKVTKSYDGWARWSGTSFASAIVSGAIAAKMTEGAGCSAWRAVWALRETDQLVGGHDGGSTPIVTAREWTPGNRRRR